MSERTTVSRSSSGGPLRKVERAAPTRPPPPPREAVPAVVHAVTDAPSAFVAPLPFLDPIQRAFGRHEVSDVRAHTGGAATADAPSRDNLEPSKQTLTAQLPVQRSLNADAPSRDAAASETSAPASSITLQMRFGRAPDVADSAAPVQRAAAAEAADKATRHALPSDGRGVVMPAAVQAKMERAFGTDFSGVRIHEGPRSQALGARAYTQGSDVHFASGEYQPGSQAGQTLIGHELTHVVQQRQGRVQATTQAKGVMVNDDAGLEHEADEMGARAALGESVNGARQDAATAQGSTSGIVQRVKWDGWEANFKNVPSSTASKAKLGMAIVNGLRHRGFVGRIGGSLSAAMFGGRRPPRDIDIDIPGNIPEINRAREVFHKIIIRKGIAFAAGKDLFFITDWKKTPEGYLLTYHHVETERELDLFEEDDKEEIEEARKKITMAPGEVSVDFSSETAFHSWGIKVDPKPEGPGYYGPDFLTASYLNRLATNIEETAPDKKGDRDQVIALLSHEIKSMPEQERPRSASEVAVLLAKLKEAILGGYISESNPRAKHIDKLFEEIIPAVVEEVAPK